MQCSTPLDGNTTPIIARFAAHPRASANAGSLGSMSRVYCLQSQSTNLQRVLRLPAKSLLAFSRHQHYRHMSTKALPHSRHSLHYSPSRSAHRISRRSNRWMSIIRDPKSICGESQRKRMAERGKSRQKSSTFSDHSNRLATDKASLAISWTRLKAFQKSPLDARRCWIPARCSKSRSPSRAF